MPPLQQISLWNVFSARYSTINCKWFGTTATQPRNGRPRKVTGWGRRVLRRIVRKSGQSSADSITAEFQTSSGINISTKTVRRELHCMGFNGRAAACKPYITEHNVKRQMESCKAATGLWSSGNVFCGVTNHASLSGSLMDQSGFGECQENVSMFFWGWLRVSGTKVRFNRLFFSSNWKKQKTETGRFFVFQFCPNTEKRQFSSFFRFYVLTVKTSIPLNVLFP